MRIEEKRLIFSMVGNVGKLFREEARIERVIDGAHAGDAVPGFDMAIGIQRQCADAVAQLDTALFECRGDAARPRRDLAPIGPVQGAVGQVADHLALGVINFGVIHDLMDQKRPILHQAQHGQSPIL